MRQYIITCDDCGLSEGINRATVALLEQGLPVAPSIMTNFPAAEHAFALFADYPALRPGLHLNLTEGAPLTQPPRPRRWLARMAAFAALHFCSRKPLDRAETSLARG